MNVFLKDLQKFFGKVAAVRNLNLQVRQGEFFSLLGPSGCGKTTTLRMIAGFEAPSAGQIFFDDKDITHLRPNRRNTGMVFQNYALFPHMTVFENIAFGLKARKVKKTAMKKRVLEVLSLVDLANYQRRKVTELSGGQQQRVALARALVIEPGILLLDEPLSNLDAKLREETRHEIRALQRRLKITTIYVTHDQEEALAISDRLAVLKDGVCQQVGTPEEIYQKPNNRFVAQFVGHSNIVEGKLIRNQSGSAYLQITPNWQMGLGSNVNRDYANGARIQISVRPENIDIIKDPTKDGNIFEGTVRKVSYSGATVEYEIEVSGHRLRVKRLVAEDERSLQEDSKALIHIPHSRIRVLV